jgi:hypothetical protein
MGPGRTWTAGVLGGVLAAALIGSAPRLPRAGADALPAHPAPPAQDGLVVQLCDGATSVTVPGVQAGRPMPPDQAVAVTRELMARWQRAHPGQRWETAEAAAPAATAAPGQRGASQQGDTYASFTERDRRIWQAETDAFVAEGNRIFHSAELLGGTIGVSCDMCHPNAANTHPETYPKYQVQLHRVALLRDMINWCIENPVKGRTLSSDDPKLRALEAYILAQRRGVPLAYGKH